MPCGELPARGLPAGTGARAVTCLAGARTRGTRRWVVVRRGTPGGPAAVLRRRPRPVGAAGREAAEEVRIHLLTPTGALVPLVLTDDVLTDDVLTDADPGRR